MTPAASGSPRPMLALSLANAVSLSGNVAATVAIPWLVLDATGSATLAALSVVSGAAAAVLGALTAGRVVDALGETRTSAVADVLSGATLAPIAVLAATHALEPWHLVVLVFLGTLVDAAGSTARQSLVPVVAGASGIARERANSLFTGSEHAGYLVGAPVAGIVIAAVGAAGAIWLDVATFAVSAALVTGVVGRHGPSRRRLRQLAPAEATDSTGARTPASPTLRVAAAFIRHDPALRALVVVPTLATMLIGPLVPILLPVIAREVYADPVALGVLVAAFGAGGLLGAFGYGWVAGRLSRRLLYVSTFLAWPFVYATLALGASIAVTVPAIALLGAGAGSLVTLQATVRQERTPVALLPRVVGLSTGPVPVVGPLSVVLAGALIDALGVGTAVWVPTAAVVALATGVATSRGVRAFDEDAPSADAIDRRALAA